MLKNSKTAEIIVSALPYIQKFRDQIFVIKYGGAAQIDEKLKKDFAKDIVLLQLVGIKVVIVHGGGKKINSFLEKLNLKTQFVDGLRVTDKSVMEVVEMTLSGLINKEIVSLLNEQGARAIGLSGKDDNMLEAQPLDNGKYGFVGNIVKVKDDIIKTALKDGFIPVIAPVAFGQDSQTYNINADLCASAIATKLKAKKVLFLSDIKGVLDKDGNLISKLNKTLIDRLKADETIKAGMIPKVDACLECVKNEVEAAYIIDGRIAHSILLEIFTDEGLGSEIKW